MQDTSKTQRPSWFPLLGVGLIGGAFAGVFGVGGGIVMVPLLLWWAHMDQKRSQATSLLAITPAAIVGGVSYGVGGIFEWQIALYVAAGSIFGAQFGAWLLRRINLLALRWGFIAFTILSGLALFFQVPQRGGTLTVTVLVAVMLFGLGLAMGVSAGLLGIGGGVIVVPALILFFGQSDLVAKGVSLLAMAPGAISGSIAHIRHRSASLRDGSWVALGAVITTPLGAILAFALDPRISATLFAVLLGLIALNLTIKAIRDGRSL